MIPIISWLRHRSLFFSFFCFGIYTYGMISASAQTGVINNTANGRADNLSDTINSNEVGLRASQAALEVIKTGDRAAAEPGDTVAYRLSIRNSGEAPTENVSITDRLPLGLKFIPKSIRGLIGDRTVPVTAEINSNRVVTISSEVGLQPNETLNVVYAVEVTPDAVRGDGRNIAQASAGNLRSNQASHRLRIRAGILSDCGTLIGRVFVDKNFDGEQQPNEPGVPNAVIFMDDGNRIVTDAKGLYSLPGVISGYRTAALDLSSLPGYALAPNKYFIERNSQSRLAKVAPGNMVRINFAVTPAFSEEKR
ncbi:MAG: NEW3 domain-containing protein [Cyanobacteria bacterium P01_A01_bin.84]